MTPEQEDRVRRVLASTPAEPMPPEVTQRLDDVLAGLVAHSRPAGAAHDERAETGVVVDLERRRRQRWPRVLVAAATVSLLAYGVGTFTNGLAGVSGDAESSVAARDGAATDSEGLDGGSAYGGDAGGAESAPEPDRAASEVTVGTLLAQGGLLEKSGTARLRSETLRADVTRLLDDSVVLTARDGRLPAKADAAARALAACELPVSGKGDTLAAVRLDGARATLVVRRPSAETRVAQVYSCDDPQLVLASTRVPARP